MSFWSMAVKGGASEDLEVEQTVSVCRYVHVTNIALAANPSDGPNTLSLVTNGIECVLATLCKGATLQYPLEIMLDSTVTFKNSGKTTIHLSGYSTISADDDGDMMDEDEVRSRGRGSERINHGCESCDAEMMSPCHSFSAAMRTAVVITPYLSASITCARMRMKTKMRTRMRMRRHPMRFP